MTHRDPNVYLPTDAARCAPSKSCGMALSCARYLAPIVQGSPVADFSVPGVTTPIWTMHICTQRIPLSDAKRPVSAPTKKVHPPSRGL